MTVYTKILTPSIVPPLTVPWKELLATLLNGLYSLALNAHVLPLSAKRSKYTTQ
ncbi:MAG: hypothetical protein ACXWTS_09715 [Methylococcaceae bacterium]